MGTSHILTSQSNNILSKMKFLAALLLVVASVHSNSLNYYGWAPGKEFVFHYQSQVLNGIPEISQSHWSGVKMTAKVHLQSYSDYTMRFRVAEPEFFTINGENVRLSEETGRVLREQESSEVVKVESIPEEFKRYLLEPVLVHIKSGVVESFLVSKMEHVLLLDGSKHIPMAVTTRTESGSEKKIVKILSGITEAQIIPSSSGSLKVLINKEEVHPTVGQKLVKKNSQGKIIAIVQRFEDNVVSVHVPEQGLKVLSNGSRIEVVAPQLLKSRTVGLCGDMNGEVSADLKTPGMCVMRPRLAAITYMLNKFGSESGFERCSGLSGLPSGLKQEFQRESTQCSRETIIPTPVSKLYERISVLNKPTGMSHIVDKQSTKLCISKQMVKTCLSKPLSI